MPLLMFPPMPSTLHEVLIEMFRDRPALAAELLGGTLRVPIPSFHEARLSSAELTDVVPTEYRADAVVILAAPDGQGIPGGSYDHDQAVCEPLRNPLCRAGQSRVGAHDS